MAIDKYLIIFKSKSSFKSTKEKILMNNKINTIDSTTDFKRNLNISFLAFVLLILGIIKPPE